VLRYAKLLTSDYIGEEPTGRATMGMAFAGISGAIVGSVLTLGLLHMAGSRFVRAEGFQAMPFRAEAYAWGYPSFREPHPSLPCLKAKIIAVMSQRSREVLDFPRREAC
jgi:hypothetical protein